MSRRDRWRIAAAAAFVFALARPWRDFPVMDDWSYAYTVKTFLETGRVRLSDWSSPSFVLQGLWGLLFCAGGFSHAALRLSTAVLGVACAWLTHRWFCRLGLPRAAAAAGACALAFNPVFVNLSLSFMTDVPFLALCLVFFNLVTPETDAAEKPRALACGLAAAAAALIRQPGAFLAAGYAAYLWKRGELTRRRAFALLLPPLLALGGFELWIRRVHGETWARYWYNGVATAEHLLRPRVLLLDACARCGWIALYAGLAALPLTLGGGDLRSRWRALTFGRRLALLAFGAAAAVVALTRFPARDALLSPTGLGRWQALGRDGKAAGFLARPAFWRLLAACGVWSFLVAGARAFSAQRRARAAVWAAAPLFVWLFVGMEFYDRYLLMLLPLLLLPAALERPRSWNWMLLAALALFSAAGELDYLNCHEAFWSASRALEARGIAPDEIWSTSEFVLWNGYQRDMDLLKERKGVAAIEDEDWLDLARERRRAIVSFPAAPARPDYVEVGESRYFSPLTLRGERLVVSVRAAR